MASKQLKFVYFAGRARGEQVRWILAQAGVQYEDKRIQRHEWPEVKPNTPNGSLPYLSVEGREFGTSVAIAMYLAKTYGLAGENDIEDAEILMIFDMVQDTFNASVKPFFESDPLKKAEMIKEFEAGALTKLVKFLAARLENGKTWLVGNKLTIADIVAACLLEFQQDFVKTEPAVADLAGRVMQLPNIKNWIASRPESAF